MSCPIYQRSEEEINHVLRNAWNILVHHGLLYVRWLRSSFPPDHPEYRKDRRVVRSIYNLLTSKWFSYRGYLDLGDDEPGYLILRAKSNKR